MIHIGAIFSFWCFFSSHFAPIVGKRARIVKAEDELKKKKAARERRPVRKVIAIYCADFMKNPPMEAIDLTRGGSRR